ncbi:MAG TPA: serine hydrolase domain-containing protein [Caulobacteraceae bacterium]|nr:serine hydrolase domain-containing protein [Caulobacteraceae bacterium]
MDDAPAKVSGFDAAALAKAPEMLRGVIDAGDLAGAVTLVWRKGAEVQQLCEGQRDLERGLPMTRDTLCRIASMTKPITSVAALMLMEEGKLALEDPISRWAPEFADMQVLKSPNGPLDDTYPAPRAITVEDLFTHRAGLAYRFSSVGPIAHAYDAAIGDILNQEKTPDEFLSALSGLPLVYPPGERLFYSHATDVLGFIVGRIGGRGFREFLFDRIFGPLGMVDTDFYVPPEKRDRAAVVYGMDQESGRLQPVPFLQFDTAPRFCGGGGGLISTIDDYLKFARMLLGAGKADGVRLLSPRTVELMQTNRLTQAQREVDFLGLPLWASQGFGLGVSMILDPEKHEWMGAGAKGAFGWPGAFGTWWQADPENEMILIYLIQDYLPLGPEAVTQIAAGRRIGARIALPMFQKIVYGALSG